ncbi:MAG: hypothetical protein MZV63_05860 [Marinilabiliales bacterium]|nr:hypothetical protein [Marinilabiliales bacterium]
MTGGTAGSFLGLLLLAAVYSAAGLFSSSLTENQVVSFIIAAVLSFVVFTGFDSTRCPFRVFRVLTSLLSGQA